MKSFSLSANLGVLLFGLVISLGISLLSYYHILYSSGNRKMIFLFVLRSVAVFMAFILISEPILTFISKTAKLPTIAILIDDSKSMGIKDRIGDRREYVKRIADKLTQIKIQGEKKFFTFSGDVKERTGFTPESLSFSGGVTDIGSALRKIQGIATQENIKSIVLISDGVYNAGENPIYVAEKLGVPVFTIVVGDSNVQKDLKVVDVLTNEISYAGVETPIVARIESAELGGNEVVVSLHDEEKEIVREKIVLNSGVNEYLVNFKFTPKEEGLKKLTIKVQHLPGEVTYQNNQKSFYVKVLRSKYKILIISGAPSPDFAFVKRVLKENKNYEVISYTERPDGRFIEGEFDIKNAETSDVIIFIGYPVKTSDPQIMNRLKNVLTAQNKPILFVMSRTVNFDKLRSFIEILPFKFSRILEDEEVINLSITDEGRNHTVMDLKERNHIWNILPPVFKLRGVFSAIPGSIILAKAKYQNVETGDPLIIASHLGSRKSLAILCYGIWRWKLMTAPNKEFEGLFETFINNSIRWLIAPVEEEFIKFKISKNFFSEDEKVEFSSQVYSEDYSPLSDAEVRVSILSQESNEIVRAFNLEPVAAGIYSGSLSFSKGDYRYEASVSRRGKVLKNFVGRFTVGESEVEFLNTRADSKLLREIASKSGGVFLRQDEIEMLSELITSTADFKPAVVERKSEYVLRLRFEPLVIVIVLLSIEWFLRKRFGLA